MRTRRDQEYEEIETPFVSVPSFFLCDPFPPSPPFPQAALPAISFNRRINALNALCEGSKYAHSSGRGGVLRCRGGGGAALFTTPLDAGALFAAGGGGVMIEGAVVAGAAAFGALAIASDSAASGLV